MGGKPRLSHENRNPAFPSMYALFYVMMRPVAMKHGYALALHGSLGRDLDVLACPWTKDAAPAVELVAALGKSVGCLLASTVAQQEPTEKPHGRRSWVLSLAGGGYVDLSVMPRARG